MVRALSEPRQLTAADGGEDGGVEGLEGGGLGWGEYVGGTYHDPQ